jgi:hypothetical protein
MEEATKQNKVMLTSIKAMVGSQSNMHKEETVKSQKEENKAIIVKLSTLENNSNILSEATKHILEISKKVPTFNKWCENNYKELVKTYSLKTIL